MRIAMDADCLIKLTKASLKEKLVTSFTILIPEEVEKESAGVDLAADHPDSLLIQRNVANELIKVRPRSAGTLRQTEVDLSGLGAGERGLLELYAAGLADTVATDDSRLLRVLRSLGVPHSSTAALLVLLVRDGAISKEEALRKLDSLRKSVSREHHDRALRALGGQ